MRQQLQASLARASASFLRSGRAWLHFYFVAGNGSRMEGASMLALLDGKKQNNEEAEGRFRKAVVTLHAGA